MTDNDPQRRAWRLAEQLSLAGGGDAKLTTTPTGYRIELAILRPHGADDHRAVLDALALGDRWGHRYSPPSRNDGTARETVWSEIHTDPPPEATEARAHRPDGSRAGEGG
ncbi:hypothetical protein HUT16_15060 [Kitasatospora sp. NA04385]|uniref:hypothetical protein n=1 Tax=Kitasatospora sp. NA04385 TaxID=2742135 RepID=UPI001590A8DF|nr:hypothetical protein [Kitasatospora sp. NA04385]QKW20212.1 hypothetical protein HUT16_15060 [Kitasatospora sp. NA04385]